MSDIISDQNMSEAQGQNIPILRPRKTGESEIVEGKTEKSPPRPPTVTILKSRTEVFSFLRDFSNFRHFMPGILNVTSTTPKLHHWSAERKNHSVEEWDTEILDEVFDQEISWKVSGNTAFEQIAKIELKDPTNGEGCVVSLTMNYTHWIGEIWGATAKVVGKGPDTQAAIQLRRLKAYLETGEVPTIEGQSSGRDIITH